MKPKLSTITKKSTGITSNYKIVDLRSAVDIALKSFVAHYCNVDTTTNDTILKAKIEKLIDKQQCENICPLKAEYWSGNGRWGYILNIFCERFTDEFKDFILKNLKSSHKDYVDIDYINNQQIKAGTQYP